MGNVAEVIMSFDRETKVKDIAVANPAAQRVLEQAGLDYCCGGGKSLHEACLDANVPPEQILARLRENSGSVGPEEENWKTAPLHDLTRHILEKHHRYVREAIPRIRALLEKVEQEHGTHHSEIAGIEALFLHVGREMIMHMQKEEQILFPYIEALEQAVKTNSSLEVPFFQTVRNPIHAMMKEHDAAGDLVKQIRAASSGYAAPSDACPSYRTLYRDLGEFEADLHQHVHLENNLLFPRAAEMEAAVF
jgi:regulator of cell morphogenesis and NO signaling